MTTPDSDPPAGLAEEAARLLAAAQRWLAARAPVTDASASEGAQPVAVCRGCPLCQLLALAREMDPAAAGHLADAVGSIGLAIREVLAEHTPSAHRHDESRVEHIDVG